MSVLSRPMFNRGGMVHDERTIRNVDDEIYRIAPKTHGGGRQRMDAREEYGRLLREKDYLRGQMNRMANGGGVAAMMDPAMMGGPPMPMGPAPMPMEPPPAAMDNELAAMEQQGMALGADIAMQQEAAIDTADNPKQLIDAMRGNELPLQERYDELATFVGPNDAAITPTSVLALTQPAIIMASEGAVDQGIGNLMEGMTGDVMMDDAMGAAPMGMGVGELMAGSPPPPVPMNTGGAVPKLEEGSNPFETAPMRLDLGTEAKSTRDELREIIGMTDQERALQESAIYGNMFDRFLALAANKDPRTGEDLEGNLFQKAGQVGQGFLTDVAKARAPEIQRETQLSQIALQDALARRTAQEKAGYDYRAQQAMGPSRNQLMGVISDPATMAAYGNNTLPPSLVPLVELGLQELTEYRDVPALTEDGQPYFERQKMPLPAFYQGFIDQREGLLGTSSSQPSGRQSLPEPAPVDSETTPEQFNQFIDQVLTSDMSTGDGEAEQFDGEAFINELQKRSPEQFGTPGFLRGIADRMLTAATLNDLEVSERAVIEQNLRDLNTNIILTLAAGDGLSDRSNRQFALLTERVPNLQDIYVDPGEVYQKYAKVLADIQEDKRAGQANMNNNFFRNDRAAMQKLIVADQGYDYTIKQLIPIVEIFAKEAGFTSNSGFNVSDRAAAEAQGRE